MCDYNRPKRRKKSVLDWYVPSDECECDSIEEAFSLGPRGTVIKNETVLQEPEPEEMPEVLDVKSGFQAWDHNGWYVLDGRDVVSIGNATARSFAQAHFGANLPDASEAYQTQPVGGGGLGSTILSNQVTIQQENLPPKQSTHIIPQGSFANGDKYATVAAGSFNPGTGVTTIPSGSLNNGVGEAVIPAGSLSNGTGSGLIPQAGLHSGLNVSARCDPGSLYAGKTETSGTVPDHSHLIYSYKYSVAAGNDKQIFITLNHDDPPPADPAYYAWHSTTFESLHNHDYGLPPVPETQIYLPIEGLGPIPSSPYTLNVSIGDVPAVENRPTVDVGPVPSADYLLNHSIGPVPSEDKTITTNIGDVPGAPYVITVDNKDDMNIHDPIDKRPRSILVNFFVYLSF